MILCFMSSSPTSGSVLTGQSLEPASHSASPSLSSPPPPMLSLSLSLSLSKINIKKNLKTMMEHIEVGEGVGAKTFKIDE